MYIRTSDLAGSSGCVPYLASKFRPRGRAWRGGSKSFFPATFSQELGTAVHELIQYVLSKSPEKRRQIAEEMERDLGMLRTTLKPSALLKEALPDRVLEKGLRVDIAAPTATGPGSTNELPTTPGVRFKDKTTGKIMVVGPDGVAVEE